MPGIYIATEDELSTAVAQKIVKAASTDFDIYDVLCRGGYGYLKSHIREFSNLAKNVPVFLMTDLDNHECPPGLINNWRRGTSLPENLIFRVCVREVESWLLADHNGIKSLLGPRIGKLNDDPDALDDPKRELLKLADKAPRRIKSELIAEEGSAASQGLGYNSLLSNFIKSTWDLEAACTRSSSLNRAYIALTQLRSRL
jgi:hypothetical protein